MMKKREYGDRDIRFITETAAELNKTRPIYYTGHCTGEVPYQMMKEIMRRREAAGSAPVDMSEGEPAE